MSTGLHTVHVRVNDEATGRPTPVRIRFESADGTYLAPFGRLTDIPTNFNEHVGGNVIINGREYAYIDGTCEIRLPADPVTVEVWKGPEYAEFREQVCLGPGKLTLRFGISRWIDLRAEGWYSGDICSHFLTPHAALLEGAAENLAVVNLLARMWPSESCPDEDGERRTRWIVPNVLAFSGQQPALQATDHLVVVNTLNTHHALGSVALLNCHRIVYPLAFGGAFGPDDWTLAAWCDQCHRKGGLVALTNYRWRTQEGASHWKGEGLADLILGKVDALEISGGSDASEPEDWYTLLNAGLRATPVAGSFKSSNIHRLGVFRTYARVQPATGLTYQNWIEAVRAGRTFITNGPLLALSVNGAEPGTVVELPPEAGTVRVRAEARSWLPLSRVEVIQNGRVVAQCQPPGSALSAIIDADVPVGAGGWLAARYADDENGYAHSGPVYVRRQGQPVPTDPDALAILHRQLDNTLEWVRTEGRFENDRQRENLASIFHSAKNILQHRAAGL